MGESEVSQLGVNISNIGLIISYILLGITALGVLVFFVVDLFKDPQQAVRTVAMLAGVIVVFLLGIAFAGSGVEVPKAIQLGLDGTTVRMVGGALITVYILAILGIIGIVVSEVMTLFR